MRHINQKNVHKEIEKIAYSFQRIKRGHFELVGFKEIKFLIKNNKKSVFLHVAY